MTNTSTALITLLAGPFFVFGQLVQENRKPSAAELAITKLLDEQTISLKKKDLETLDRIWSGDYIFINPAGQIVTRDQRLNVLGSIDTRIDLLNRDEVNIRTYGDSAVVISRTTAKGRVAGKDIDGQFRATTVLVKNNGQWQIVSHQDNVIPAP